jgi:uncharacterized protein
MPTYTYPGVYIEELPSGVNPITGVATSIAAFVGWAAQGPTSQAVMVLSWSDFARQFGGLDARSYLGYAVSQFFNNGGQQAYIIRIVAGAPTATGSSTATAATVTVNAPGSTAGTPLGLVFTALQAINGAAGNGFGVQITVHSTGNTFDVATVYAPNGTAWVVLESFPSLTTSTVVSTITGASGSKYLTVSLLGTPTTLGTPAQNTTSLYTLTGGTDGNGINVPSPATASTTINSPGSTTLGFAFAAQSPGQWGNLLAIGATPQAGDPTNTRFSVNVVQLQSNGALQVVESFNNLSVNQSDPQYVVTIINADSNYVTASAVGVPTQALNSPYPPSPLPSLPYAAPPFLTGGLDGRVIQPQDGLNGDGSFEIALNINPTSTTGPPTSGIHLLDNVDIFNILCVPGETDAPTISLLQQYCNTQRAFYVVDCPQTATAQSLATSGPAGATAGSITGVYSINSAYYYPWVQAPDPLVGNRVRIFPPCGFVAGIYAATDAAFGVWKAPAGIDASLTGVSGLQYVLNDAQQGQLNPQAINCLRQFRVYGDVVWGARTLAGNDQAGSQWKYLNIRRFALFLESSLYDGTQWVVFESNDDTLWGQIRLNVGSFMQGLFLQGAFQGTSPQQAYFVKCDSENNPQSSIDLGIVNILVGFAPLYPAEFVVIQIQQMAGQLSS